MLERCGYFSLISVKARLPFMEVASFCHNTGLGLDRRPSPLHLSTGFCREPTAAEGPEFSSWFFLELSEISRPHDRRGWQLDLQSDSQGL